MGDLPTLEHSVDGFLYVRDNKTLVIRDFAYDGLGPGDVMTIYLTIIKDPEQRLETLP